jgi:hypothetical protein
MNSRVGTGALKAALVDAGVPIPTTWEVTPAAHHLIPGSSSKRFKDLLEKIGYSQNSAKNGTFATRSKTGTETLSHVHGTTHPGYTAAVENALTRIREKYEKLGLFNMKTGDPGFKELTAQAREDVAKLQIRCRNEIQNPLSSLKLAGDTAVVQPGWDKLLQDIPQP